MDSQYKKISLFDVQEFFAYHAGPVFCVAGPGAIHAYSKLGESVGILHPVRNDKFAGYVIDWTISKNWLDLKAYYPSLNIHPFMVEEIHILGPLLDDIPQLVDDLSAWDWRVSGEGQEVIIHPARMNDNVATWKVVLPYVGLVRHFGHNLCTVAFDAQSHNTKIRNIPTDSLIRVPSSFRKHLHAPKIELPEPMQKTPVHSLPPYKPPKKEPKYKTGDIVKGTGSLKDDEFVGMIGVVVSVMEKAEDRSTSFSVQPSFIYKVNFDTLPNRSMSLCSGENDLYLSIRTCSEYEIDNHNVRITEKAHLLAFKTIQNREDVWVMDRRCEGRVYISNMLKDKSIADGAMVEVETDKSKGKFTVSCRDIDYLYNTEKLYTELSLCDHLSLAIEPDSRDPNNPESRCYIYGTANNNPNRIHLRVLLGCLSKSKKVRARLGKALTENTIEHPWQVHRYLRKKRMGYFYEIMEAKQYLNYCKNFVSWTEND